MRIFLSKVEYKTKMEGRTVHEMKVPKGKGEILPNMKKETGKTKLMD